MSDDTDLDDLDQSELDSLQEELDSDRHVHSTGVDQPKRSLAWRVLVVIVDNLGLIVGALGLLVFSIAVMTDVQIPRWLKVAGLAGSGSLVFVGRPVGSKVRDWLWQQTDLLLVDLDARYTTGAIYRVPSQNWEDWKVENGSVDWVAPRVVITKNVDLLERTCEGTWRGTLTDRELLTALHRIDECREMLEEDAKAGFAIEAQAWTIIRSATRDAVLSIVDTFEETTLPDRGEGVSQAIEDALERFDIDRAFHRTEADDFDPASDAPGPADSDLLDPDQEETADD
jgi:hypothetical protein